MVTFIRWLLSLLLISYIYTETGIATTIFAVLACIRWEFHDYIAREKTKARMKRNKKNESNTP